jgi:hypothetical protein
VLAIGVLALVLAFTGFVLAGEVLVLLGVVGDKVVGVSTVVASFLQTPTTPVVQAVVVNHENRLMTNASLSSSRASNCSSMIDIKEDKANDICEGLAKELDPLPKTKAIVGAEGFLILA